MYKSNVICGSNLKNIENVIDFISSSFFKYLSNEKITKEKELISFAKKNGYTIQLSTIKEILVFINENRYLISNNLIVGITGKEKDINKFYDYLNMVGSLVKKKSERPFKSGKKEERIIGITTNKFSNSLGFLFEDDSIVNCGILKPIVVHSDEVIELFYLHQNSLNFHPYTCGSNDCRENLEINHYKLYCPCCGYYQKTIISFKNPEETRKLLTTPFSDYFLKNS